MESSIIRAWAIAIISFFAVNPLGFVVSVQDSFYFLVMCDPQIGWNRDGYNSEKLFEEAVERANGLKNSTQPEFVVICGDLIQKTGSDIEFRIFENIASKLEVPYFTVAGNHDVSSKPTLSTLSTYMERTGQPLWYAHEYNNTLLVFLETNMLKVRDSADANEGIPDLAMEQMNWLSETLKYAQGGNNTIIVFGHQPLARKNVNEGEGDNMPQPIRSELLDLFHKYDVSAYFAGHFHYNKYIRDGDLELVTYSATGVQLRNDKPGFGIVQILPGEGILHQYYTFYEVPSQANLSVGTTTKAPLITCVDNPGKFANHLGKLRSCIWLTSSGKLDQNCGGKSELGDACQLLCRNYTGC